VDKGSFSPHPAFLVCVIDDGHSDWVEVEFQCSSELHFNRDNLMTKDKYYKENLKHNPKQFKSKIHSNTHGKGAS
jgi:hypothetical protein